MNKNLKRGVIKSVPKKWTETEIDFLKELKKKGLNNIEIAKELNRTEISIQIKLKRLSKNNNEYNKKHIEEKYFYNDKFLKYVEPKSILDVYAGESSFYNKYHNIKLTTNDRNKEFKNNNYNLDALKLLCKLYYEGNSYDLIDLDPFGSCYECLNLAIKMSKKALIVTLGEMGHKRWKRLDYVKRCYDIDNLKDFTSDSLVQEIKKIALKNKKELYVQHIKDWNNISRVYFIVRDIVITEQWTNLKW